MKTRVICRIAAVCLMIFGAVSAIPGCVIRIGTGTDVDGSGTTDPGTLPTPEPPPPNTEPTEDELAAMIAAADPQQVAIANAKAGYVSYYTMGLIQSSVGDPSTIDEETLMVLVEQFAPQAWQAANDWIATIDPITLASPGVPFAYECASEPWNCEGRVSCPFAKICILTGCGTKGCGPCPDIFDLNKIVYKSYCSYTCVVGSDVVGVAIQFISRFKLLTHLECFPNK